LQRAERVTTFAVSLFEEARPEVAQGDTLSAFDMLDRGQARLADELQDEPLPRVVLTRTIGDLRMAIGDYGQARSILTKAVSLARELGDSLEVASSLLALGGAHQRLGEHEAAIRLYESAAALWKTVLGPNADKVGEAWYHAGMTLAEMGRYAEAREAFETSSSIVQLHHPSDAAVVLRVRHSLADMLAYEGSYEEALDQYHTLQAAQGRVYGDSTHIDVVRLHNDMAWTYNRLGEHAEASRHYSIALRAAQRLYGKNHPHVVSLLSNVGSTFEKTGNYERARASYEEALSTALQVLPEGHPLIATVASNLGTAHLYLGEGEEAIAQKRSALAMAQHAFPAPHPLHAQIQIGLAKALDRYGRAAEAQTHFEQVLATWRRVHSEAHPEIAQALHDYASHARARHQSGKAIALQREAVEVLGDLKADALPIYPTALLQLAKDLDAEGERTDARRYAAEAVRVFSAQRGADDAGTRESEELLARLSAGT
ncbi:MAG: tetratricopeptide repeat protein, partial [Bacteroidota bacterium]